MELFNNIKRITDFSLTHLKKIYQYSSGEYLPDSSQPNPDENFEITTRKYTPHFSTRYTNVSIGSNGLPQNKGKDCEKPLPELYKAREECCGCAACYSICPVCAIQMRPDEEGFLYPVVDAENCMRCYKCCSICPVKRKSRNG